MPVSRKHHPSFKPLLRRHGDSCSREASPPPLIPAPGSGLLAGPRINSGGNPGPDDGVVPRATAVGYFPRLPNPLPEISGKSIHTSQPARILVFILSRPGGVSGSRRRPTREGSGASMSVVGTGIGENPGTPVLHYERAVPTRHLRRCCRRARHARVPLRTGYNGEAARPPKRVRDALRRRGGRSTEHLPSDYPSRCSIERPRPWRPQAAGQTPARLTGAGTIWYG